MSIKLMSIPRLGAPGRHPVNVKHHSRRKRKSSTSKRRRRATTPPATPPAKRRSARLRNKN